MQTPAEKLMASIEALKALGDVMLAVIKAEGVNGMPSGHLYAAVMPCGMGLAAYAHMVDLLIEAGRIRRSNHVLYYVK